jgi:ribosomal protein S6--L-glutamate ligase
MVQLKIGVLDFEKIGKTPIDNGKVKKASPTRFFQNAILARGHKPVIYRAEKCQMYFGKKKASILYNHKKIKGCDILLPRLDFSVNIDLEISIIKQFQLMGIPVLNQYLSISGSKNKLRTLQILTRNKVPVPKTIVVRRIEFLDDAIKKIGGYPVIIKAPFGSYGKEVAIIESRRSLTSALDVMWKDHRSSIILIQEYVAEAEGSDFRLFVVGDKVVAAMKRTAVKGDFRSNLQLGGVGSKTTISEEEVKMAVKATKALGLDICGVDILRSKSGPVVMEMNANPGVEGISGVTGINVAEEIVEFAELYLINKK